MNTRVCVCVFVHVRAQQTVVHFCTSKAVLREGRQYEINSSEITASYVEVKKVCLNKAPKKRQQESSHL